MAPDFYSTLSSLQRTLQDYSQFWRGGREMPALRPDLPDRDAEWVRRLMAECLAARSGEVAARQQAAVLGELYLTLNDQGRLRFLGVLAEGFRLDRDGVCNQARKLLEHRDSDDFPDHANQLRSLLDTPQQRLLQQFNGLPNGIKFLIDLRADLRRYQRTAPGLRTLDGELYRLLASWFDIGFLEMRRLTWQSPAALLEKLITYEAVHSIQSWDDLRHRLESDRHCYAFFHPALPGEPLIFIEVALVEGLATSIQNLLDPETPEIDPGEADTAIFYSISNTQNGLQGISFGPFLIKQVVTTLQRMLPNLKVFSTLSPIPGFRTWLLSRLDDPDLAGERAPLIDLLERGAAELGVASQLPALIDHADWPASRCAADMKAPLTHLAALYLQEGRRRDGAPLDPVARFHLGNGARIEQLNWLGDVSDKGIQESCGLMVNYLYRLKDIEKNIEAYAAHHQMAASSRVRALLRSTDEEEGPLARLSRFLPARRASPEPPQEHD